MTNRGIANAAVLLVLWIVALGAVSSASQSRSLLPVVYGSPLAVSTLCDGKAPIHDRDTGDLDAVLTTDGRFILAYQDRAGGSLVHVAEHIGAGIEEVPGPVALALASAVSVPQFSPSGPKQGSVALVTMAGGKNRLYYTQRKPGDETGPYGIWCIQW